MAFEVEHGKAADVANAFDMYSELAEEVDDRRSAGRKGEPEDKRRQKNGGELSQKEGDLHLEQLTKLLMDLTSQPDKRRRTI